MFLFRAVLWRILNVLKLCLTAKWCGCWVHVAFRAESVWSSSVEWCAAVSGWFGLCSVGGQAPVQIKDFSVKVPDSATVMWLSKKSVCERRPAEKETQRLPPNPTFFFLFFFKPVIKNKPQTQPWYVLRDRKREKECISSFSSLS